jgi:tryptophan-rich sensory protein
MDDDELSDYEEDGGYSILPTNPGAWTMLLSSIVMTVLFFVTAYYGAQLAWYKNLTKSGVSTWLIAGLWIFASILSYAAFYFIRNADPKFGTERLLPLYLIISILNVLWIMLFYYFQSFIGAITIIGIIILYNFYIIWFLWRISILAALSMVPLQALYIYLLYDTIHLASINQIVL